VCIIVSTVSFRIPRNAALAVLLALLAPLTCAQTGRRLALVIGNSSYRGVPTLEVAANDARTMSASLTQAGFSVRQVINATQMQFADAVRQFASDLRPDDVAFFYYCGYAAQSNDDNFITPVDFDTQDPRFRDYPGFSLERVQQELAATKVRLKILVIDATRSNPLVRALPGLAAMQPDVGSYILFSAGPGISTEDRSSSANGLIATHIAKALAEPNLELDTLFQRIRAEVYSATGGRQIIWTSSAVIGTFYLTAAATTGRPSSPERPAPPANERAYPPVINVTFPQDGAKLAASSTELVFTIDDRQRTIQSLSILVNGQPLPSGGARGATLLNPVPSQLPSGQKHLDFRVPIELARGDNLVEIKAGNGAAESIRVLALSAAGSSAANTLPDLWMLSIGINRYASPRISKLDFAEADAKSIAAAFRQQEGKLFRKVNTLVISDSSPVKPVHDEIVDNLRFLRRAGQNDVIVLFLAAHALNDEDGEFTLLPADTAFDDEGELRQSKIVRWTELTKILEFPGKKIMLLDTCHSAGVSGKKSRGVDNADLVTAMQKFGPVIFTSSQQKELSLESLEWGHGAFTKALLEGLEGAAFPESTGVISMKALDLYVSRRVPELTKGKQHPVTHTPDGYSNFAVALAK